MDFANCFTCSLHCKSTGKNNGKFVATQVYHRFTIDLQVYKLQVKELVL